MNRYVFGDSSTSWISVFTGGLWLGGHNIHDLKDLVTLHRQLLNRGIPAVLEIGNRPIADSSVSAILVHCSTPKIETILRLSMIGTLWCGEPKLRCCYLYDPNERMLAAARSCGLKYTIDKQVNI
jgi:hypothetical protein